MTNVPYRQGTEQSMRVALAPLLAVSVVAQTLVETFRDGIDDGWCSYAIIIIIFFWVSTMLFLPTRHSAWSVTKVPLLTGTTYGGARKSRNAAAVPLVGCAVRCWLRSSSSYSCRPRLAAGRRASTRMSTG